MNFSTIDLIIFGSSIVLLMVYGLWLSRKGKNAIDLDKGIFKTGTSFTISALVILGLLVVFYTVLW